MTTAAQATATADVSPSAEAPPADVAPQDKGKTNNVKGQTPIEPPAACPAACPELLLGKKHDDSHGCANLLCTSFTGVCNGPGLKVTLKYCPCRKIQYCSKECQKIHWGIHNSTCSIAKANKDADWMDKATHKLGQKRPAMHGVKFLASKCLGCKRNVIVQPEAKYALP